MYFLCGNCIERYQKKQPNNSDLKNRDDINDIENSKDFDKLYYHKNFIKNDIYQKRNQKTYKFCYNTKKIDKLKETPGKNDNYAFGIIGLINLGYSCYFNSALQNLKNVYPLTLHLLKNYQKFNKSGFTYSFCELISNLIYQPKNQYYKPVNFFYHLQRVAPNFRIGEQKDSSICIMHILNNLEKETKKLGEPNPEIIESLNEEEKEKFKYFIYKSYNTRNSYILDYFYGFQEDIYKCMKKTCNYINYSYQGFTILNLPIVRETNDRIYKLEDAIKYYQYGRLHKKDDIGFDCPICEGKNIMTQTKIISYPKILMINFKRIGEKYFYNHTVEVPPILNLDRYNYELFGFIDHIGGAGSGHNIAICKNFFDKKWYEYDDSEVIPLEKLIGSDKKPDTKNGFLFFYKKLDIFENIETEQDKNMIIAASSELRK